MGRAFVDSKSYFGGTPYVIQVDPTGVDTYSEGMIAIPTYGAKVNPTLAVLGGGGFPEADSVVGQVAGHLLAQYPQYSNIYFNPLLTTTDISALDLTGPWTPGEVGTWSVTDSFPIRCQVGRAAGPQAGLYPTRVAVLPANTSISPNRPGVLLTSEIDLSLYALDCFGDSLGANQFTVFWYLYDLQKTHDVYATHGAVAGNTPAHCVLRECDQSSGIMVFLSTDNGGSWCQVDRFKPVHFTGFNKKIRLAFVTVAAGNPVYLASFGVLF